MIGSTKFYKVQIKKIKKINALGFIFVALLSDPSKVPLSVSTTDLRVLHG